MIEVIRLPSCDRAGELDVEPRLLGAALDPLAPVGVDLAG
jgi:hypothetical protein